MLGLKTIILLCTSYMTLYNIDINQNVNFICNEIQYNTKNCLHIYSFLPCDPVLAFHSPKMLIEQSNLLESHGYWLYILKHVIVY